MNEYKYDVVENCTNIATLTSTVKLFLREMPDPLITKEMIDYVRTANLNLSGKGDPKTLISQLKKSLTYIDKIAYRNLHFILEHAKLCADEGGKLYCLIKHYLITRYYYITKVEILPKRLKFLF